MKRTKSDSVTAGVVNLSLAQYSQTDTNRNSDAVLYFVIPDELTETTCSAKLRSVKELCDGFCLTSEWLEEEELRKMRFRVNNVFVVDPFKGPAYEYLEQQFFKSKRFMVIGPQCLRYALNREDMDATMQSRGFPFYTMGMRNICVSFTGFQSEEQKELAELVQKMNGIVSKAFAVATTHVVAHNVLTPKCTEAFKKEVPVMTADWIKEVWRDSQEEIIDATDKKYIEQACKLFHGIRICVSQIPSAMKNAIEKIIKLGGGYYTKDFRRHETHVLIVPNASGEKYKFAKQWQIPAVTPEWVNKCKDAGHIVPFEGFEPSRRPVYNSTQILEDVEPQVPNMSNIASISAIGDFPESSRIDVANASKISCNTILTAPDGLRKQELDILQNAPDGFLDGCDLYLFQVDSSRSNYLEILLMSASVTLSKEFSGSVTHVIVFEDSISEKELKLFKREGHTPHVVSFQWLLQCAQDGKQVDEHGYVLTAHETTRAGPSRISRDVTSLRNEMNVSLGVDSQEPVPRNSEFGNVTSGRNSGDKMQRNLSQSAFVQPECVQRPKSIASKIKEEATGEIADEFAEPESAGVEEKLVLYGLKFMVKLESSGAEELIKAAIIEASGDVVEEKDINCDEGVTIVLPSVYQPFQTKASVLQCCTKYWVTEVINEKSLEIPERFYHTPLEVDSSLSDLLQGVVLAMSAYSSVVKEYITQLATSMGAIVQEVFSRKDTKGSLKSTHLLCGVKDNDKVRAAQRWGTPCVSCEWIVECYKKKQRICHKDFDLQDNSDATMYMKTPNTQVEKYRKLCPSTSTASSRGGGASVIPGTDKSKYDDGFRRPEGLKQAKLNFNDLDSPVRCTPAVLPSAAPEEEPESPLIRPGMSRQASRYLKRAIEWQLADTPPAIAKQREEQKRRRSTPIDDIMKDINELMQQRLERRRRELNISPFQPFKRAASTANAEDNDRDESTAENEALVDEEENDYESEERTSKRAKMSDKTDVPKVSTESSRTTSAGCATGGDRKGSSVDRDAKVSAPSQDNDKNDAIKFKALSKVIDFDDDLPGVVDDGEASEVGWAVEPEPGIDKKQTVFDGNKVSPNEEPGKENIIEEQPPVLIPVDEVSPKSSSSRNDKNVKKKRGTGSSASSYHPPSGASTRSTRSGASASKPKYCFAVSGGTVADKESYKSIFSRFGGTLSGLDHYDPKADAVIAGKVARSEKILGSIAAGKPILHPSYSTACDEAGELLNLDGYIWKEDQCKSQAEKNMTRVATYWYNKIKDHPKELPYAKFRVGIFERKASKSVAYTRLIEAGGGQVVTDKKKMNIIIGDTEEAGEISKELNIPIKVALYLNDVIINYDTDDLELQ